MNAKQMADSVLIAVKSFVDGAVGTVSKRMDALEIRMSSVKDGRDGVDGQKGADGIDGKDGSSGRDGVDGRNGVDGKDGERGKDGEKGLPGIDGADGNHGVNGADGINGRNGLDGKDGSHGTNGIDGQKGADGLNGKDGKDGLNGKDGAAGINGKDADEDAITARIMLSLDEIVRKHVSLIPIPRDGRDGATGERGSAGEKGSDGRDGRDADAESITRMVMDHVDKSIAAIPRPVDGRDGKDADPSLIDAQVQKAVGAIPVPQDGKSVTVDDVRPMLEAEVAKWELDFERRSQVVIQRAIDRIPTPADGRDGSDGKDGLSVDDFDVNLKEDGRTLVIKIDNGRVQKEREIKLAVPLYMGVYKQGEAYAKGDTVTYGGSLYIAQVDGPASPGDGASWRLAVKRGADAK